MLKYLDSAEEFKSLINYYISCLEKEDILSLTFNREDEHKKFFSNFFKKEELFQEKKDQVILKKTDELKSFFREHKQTQGNKPLFYGYPLFVNSDGKISPIFFTEVFDKDNKDSIMLTKESINPEFNHHILKGKYNSVEETKQIQLEINESSDFKSKMALLLELLDLKKSPISKKLDQKPIIIRSKDQIINKAILYSGEKTGFSKGLLKELETLRNEPLNNLKSSSLGPIFNNHNHFSGKKKDILEIFRLNKSQKKAVEGSFQNNLSVITGPPGTGKSQVVLNLIANAIWNDERVLFASKNNKAVDVVNNKLKSILSQNLVIRTGTREHRKKAKIQIQEIFEKKAILKISSNIEEDLIKIKEIKQQITVRENNINEMSSLQEKFEEEQKKLTKLIEEIPKEEYNASKDDRLEQIDKFELEKDITLNFEYINFFRMISEILLPSVRKRREHQIFQKYYSQLEKKFRDYLTNNLELRSHNIESFLKRILTLKKIISKKDEIRIIEQKITKFPPLHLTLSKIEKYHDKIVNISAKILENYWFKKLRSMSVEDENHFSRYLDASNKLESENIQDKSLYGELIREQIAEIQEMLPFLPAWVVTNLSIRSSLPLKQNLFDLLIIDEASQCDIASVLPLLYRSKRAVIIGDPKQLKHVSTMKDYVDKNIASKKGISKLYLDYAYSKNSLYDLVERITKQKNQSPVLLDQHYRSHRHIIDFSNRHFYDGKLNIKTKEISSNDIHPVVSWENVEGRTIKKKSSFNNAEAISVIKILKKYSKSENKGDSFGIVTIFRPQADLINSIVARSKELENMNISVGTTHKFQGDEKDIMIFSPAVSDGIQDGTVSWINNTTQLLNVAVTRARKKFIVVGNKKKCYNVGGILKSLVEYVESKNYEKIRFDSPIEEEFYKKAIIEGINLKPQYTTKVKGKKTYCLDFALFVNNNKYDIEIDGAKAHHKRTQHDALRDKHLEMEGWRIRRFSAKKIKENIDGVIEEIKRLC